MSGPQDGKYLIQLAVDGPNLPIGVEFGGAPVKPVITEGSDNVVSPLVFVGQLRSPFIGMMC
jgi:hypothetical protein